MEKKRTERGAGLALNSSLRIRVTLATALAFVGLGTVVCLVLPRSYTEQLREGLRERTCVLMHGVAHAVQHEQLRDPSSTPQQRLRATTGWLDMEPDFDSVILLDHEGRSVAHWPSAAEDWSDGISGEAPPHGERGFFVSAMPVGGEDVATVALRTSTARLAVDLENMRWLFTAVFVLACGAFWVLSRYLVTAIVDPLEEIRAAAMGLADGEPYVDVPTYGDREIDDLGKYIDALGRKRRQSTVMPNPLLTYLQRRSPIQGSHPEDIEKRSL